MPLGKAGQAALQAELKKNLDPVIAALGGVGDEFYIALSMAITNWIAANGAGAVSLTAASTIVGTTGTAAVQSGTGTLVPKSGTGDVI